MGMKWKKAVSVFAAAAMTAMALSGCSGMGNAKESEVQPVHLTFGHGQAEGHPYHIAALEFKNR